MDDWHSEQPATSDDEVRRRHEQNRTAWNDGAAAYTRGNAQRLANLKAGKSSLHPLERSHLQARGKLRDWCARAVHLQCASGEDTLSLWLEGAGEVVGVDIGDVHIDNARWLTRELGAPARFYRADVLDTPAELDDSADLVYTGRGALCWIHDLGRWGATVARLLRPGGVMHILDDHPLTWLFDLETTTPLVRHIDYFAHGECGGGWPETYLGNRGRTPDSMPQKHERLHNLADVFAALRAAGLVVTHLGEHSDPYWDVFPNLPEEVKRGLPMTFSMMAAKP
jgi:SAM-dependent methyltransferase